MPLSPYLKALATCAALASPAVAAACLFNCCPQTIAVHGNRVLLHLFLATVRHDGPALLVDLKHELVGFCLGIAEVALEDVAHVAHEVDGIVPDHEVPR